MVKKKKGRPEAIPAIATGSENVPTNAEGKYYSTQVLIQKIASEMERTYDILGKNAGTEVGSEVQAEIEKEIALTVARIKHKAIKQFELMLDSPMPPSIRLGYLRFAIGEDLAKGTGPRPDQLVFETEISETGTVEQTQRKIYTRTTITKGGSSEDPDNAMF